MLVLGAFGTPAAAQTPANVDRICPNPALHTGLLLRVRAPTLVGNRPGSVVGPMIRCAHGFLVLGPYLGQDQTELPVSTAAIRRLWVRGNAGPIGLLVGVAVGALSGGGLAAVKSDQCTRGFAPMCHGNVVAGALIGGLAGGTLGYVLGHGFPHWDRIFP